MGTKGEARYGFLQLNEAEYQEAVTSGKYPDPTRYGELTAYYTEAHEPGWKGVSLAEMFPGKYKDLLKRGVPDRLSPVEVKTVIEEKRIPYGRGVEPAPEEIKMPTEAEKLTQEDIHVSICSRWDELDFAIKEAETKPCSQTLYAQLRSADTIDIILELCQGIIKASGGPDILCSHVAYKMALDVDDATKNLVKRCPPGAIIELIAKDFPAEQAAEEIKEVEHVCARAGAQDCLNIIKQVRTKAGK